MKSTNVQQTYQSGFTLIELLVSIGVLGFIAGIAISIFVSLSAAYDKASIIASVTREGNRMMESISRTIRSGEEIEVTTNGILISIPQEDSNLEYANNGNCREVELYYDSATSTIRKRIASTAGNCNGTPVCPDSSPCILNSDEVEVPSLVFDVTDNTTTPDVVSVEFVLRQDASLADPEQKSSQKFQKVVLTRGY